MATQARATRDLGSMNDWKERPDIVQDCLMQCHNTPHILIDAGLYEVQCRECGYTYRKHTHHEFKNPDVLRNPVQGELPQVPKAERKSPPAYDPAELLPERFVTAAEAARIAYGVAQGVVADALTKRDRGEPVGIEPPATPEEEATDQAEIRELQGTPEPEKPARKPTRFEQGHVLR